MCNPVSIYSGLGRHRVDHPEEHFGASAAEAGGVFHGIGAGPEAEANLIHSVVEGAGHLAAALLGVDAQMTGSGRASSRRASMGSKSMSASMKRIDSWPSWRASEAGSLQGRRWASTRSADDGTPTHSSRRSPSSWVGSIAPACGT